VQRVAGPFRQGLWNFFDGTATGRLWGATAGEMTAVNGATACDGRSKIQLQMSADERENGCKRSVIIAGI
jgi:hypothetical protein